jgi:hypothetical protein
MTPKHQKGSNFIEFYKIEINGTRMPLRCRSLQRGFQDAKERVHPW